MEDQNFKFSFFGGFNKKSVVDYVAKIVNKFNLEIENLKKDYEKKLEQKDLQIEDLSAQLQSRDKDLEKLQSELDEACSDQHKVDLKELAEKDVLIVKMREEIENLKKVSSRAKTENIDLEERVKRAQFAAKERVNEIIEQARSKIAAEYRKKIDDSEKEGKAIRGEAIKEASKILNNSANVAHKIINESKEKIKNFVEMAKREAKDLVDSANMVGQKIVKKSAEVVFSEYRNNAMDKLNLDCDIETVSKNIESGYRIEDDLFGAVRKLNADFLLGDDVVGDVKFSLNSDGVVLDSEVGSKS